MFVEMYYVATVLTVYGIETSAYKSTNRNHFQFVATVLTVYGIETIVFSLVYLHKVC